MSLEVVEYNFNDQKDDKRYIGLIAQDVEKVFPSIVSPPGDSDEGESFYSLDYSSTGVIAIRAIQEQQVIIDEQMNQISTLKEENEILKARLERIEKLLNVVSME